MKSIKIIKSILALGVMGVYLYLQSTPDLTESFSFEDVSSNQSVEYALQNKLSDIQVSGSATVTKILSDDNKGSRHQRFILTLPSNVTILVAHNIDLAPKITSLKRGDLVHYKGEYEWNSKGGVIHWTHKDPAGYHQHGWLKHNGRTYQ